MRYIFRKELYLKDMKYVGVSSWVLECDGTPVVFEGKSERGNIGFYKIHKDWCEEVK